MGESIIFLGGYPHIFLGEDVDTIDRIMIVLMFLVVVATNIVDREDIKTLQEKVIRLEKKECVIPSDHARIDSNVNLIGSKVFTNWEKASELYAKRGE